MRRYVERLFESQLYDQIVWNERSYFPSERMITFLETFWFQFIWWWQHSNLKYVSIYQTYIQLLTVHIMTKLNNQCSIYWYLLYFGTTNLTNFDSFLNRCYILILLTIIHPLFFHFSKEVKLLFYQDWNLLIQRFLSKWYFHIACVLTILFFV